MTNLILSETQDRITTITINRPKVRNALNQQTIKELCSAFSAAADNFNNSPVIILRGSGTESFCAGADLAELNQATSLKDRKEFFTQLSTLIQTMHSTPQTIIGAVYGFALAGGCGLAAACDIVLAAETATFGLPELQIGLAPMVVTPVIHRAIGRRALSELVLTAERIDATRAREIGLVSRIYSKNDLLSQANKLAVQITKLAPNASAIAKKLIYSVAESDYFEMLKKLPEEVALLSMQPEALERINSFLNKK